MTSKFTKPSDSSSLLYSMEQFSVLVPLQCLLLFLGSTLECQLLIMQSEGFSHTRCNQVCNGAVSVFYPKSSVGVYSL